MKKLPGFAARAAVFLLLGVQFSCGGGDSTPPPDPLVATTLTANSPTSLSESAGAQVTTRPSVLVRDQNGNPMSGVPIAFIVASGGGSLTGAAAVTNSSGVATVGGWTLGTAVGTNTVVASTGSLTPITFTANSTPGAPASLTKTAGEGQTATAGGAVAIPPSVTVKDANGNVVPGASVTFAVTTGGGSVTSGAQTTNSAGVATVGGWTLGTAAGANSLSATVGSLSAVFTASGAAGPAAQVVKSAGDNQSASSGASVAVPPSVTVGDVNGNPVAGVTVIFAVGSGEGTVTGGSQVTNAFGVATVGGWTLGAATGTNTLTATAGTLPAVTFTATATGSSACSVATPHTIGSASSGDLTTADCRLASGAYADFFSISVSTAGAYQFTETAPSFDAFLYVFGSDGWVVAVNDDASSTSLDSRIKALLPSADFILAASSFDVAITGSYTLASAVASAAVTGCEEVFIVRGVTTDQDLQSTDCVFGGFYSDDMEIYLRAGQTVTISMNSTAMDAALELWDRNGIVASNDNRTSTTTDAQIVYTVPTNDFYLIVPTSHVAGATGAYTLIVQ